MGDKIENHDFIEIEFTGKLVDGTVFDTTQKEIAKQHKFFSEKVSYEPAVICIGEKQLLPGLDEQLAGKETNGKYTITLAPEQAFGRRDVKKMKIVPLSAFRQHNVSPQPGLQIDVDGERGIVTQVSGGRIIVNFNHPLAGKEVQYEIFIKRKIADPAEKLSAYLHNVLQLPTDKFTVEVKDGKAHVGLPFELPVQLNTILIKKLSELIGLQEITFAKLEDKEKK